MDKILISIVALLTTMSAFLGGLAVDVRTNPNNALGSVAPGLQAYVATTSPAGVTTTASTIFATSTCSSRTITTVASPIMLTFSDYANQTPTALFGHLQSASTTVDYQRKFMGVEGLKPIRSLPRH